MSKPHDFAVIGAGVFGAWTAHFLRRSGASVILLDTYGPANSRASSGGETRVIRMGYGPDELYTRWAMRSLPLWREFAARTGREIFHQTGVLWLSNDSDLYLKSLCSVLAQAGVERKELKKEEIARRWPHLRFLNVTWGCWSRPAVSCWPVQPSSRWCKSWCRAGPRTRRLQRRLRAAAAS